MRTPSQRLLGAYVLPGRVPGSRPAIPQAIAAEDIGLGAVWLSEKWGTKEVGSILGAISQVTTRLRIGAGVTHLPTRHPLILASMCLTLQSLSNDRFILGVGRGDMGGRQGDRTAIWEKIGLQPQTNSVIRGQVAILRRLLEGQGVSCQDPAGKVSWLKLHSPLPSVSSPPIVISTFGFKTLQMAGECFDGVILPAFLTPSAVTRLAKVARTAAVAAGRNPSEVRIYATVPVAADLPEEELDEIIGGRAVQYLHSPYGDIAFALNNWDQAILGRLRESPQFADIGNKVVNWTFLRHELVETSRLLPRELLATSCAIGSASTCADSLIDYLDAGADELIIHASTPDRLRATVDAFNAKMIVRK